MKRLHLLLLTLLALGVAASGMFSLPIEEHEALVLRTVEEMHQRGDWITPYFNAEPRLNKPPLPYWLTGLVAWADGSLARVQVWHGRLVVVLAGLAWLYLVIGLGRRLFDNHVGSLAGLILATSWGFFTYTHNARPEMLYTALCTGIIMAMVVIWQAEQRKRPSWQASFALWVLVGLATLAKGPHLPLLLIVAGVAFLKQEGWAWRTLAQRFNPLLGLALAASLTVPWWWALDRSLGGDGLAGSQLSGTLFGLDFWGPLKLYYLYRPLQLLLPWLLLLPWVLIWVWRHRSEPAVRLLLWLYLLPALVLSFGFKQRIFYILPAFAPLILLYAVALASWARQPLVSPLWRWLAPVHAILLLLLIVALAWQTGWRWELGVLAASILTLAALGFYLRARRTAVLVLLGLMFAALLGLLGPAPVGWWSDQRYEQYELSQAALKVLRSEDSIAAYRYSARAFVYYLHHPVHEVNTLAEVRALPADKVRYLIVPKLFAGLLDELPGTQTLYVSPYDGKLALRLVKLP